MSLIRARSDLPLLWQASTKRRCRSSSAVCRSSSVMPITPLSGVRSSWLIEAKNRLLANVGVLQLRGAGGDQALQVVAVSESLASERRRSLIR